MKTLAHQIVTRITASLFLLISLIQPISAAMIETGALRSGVQQSTGSHTELRQSVATLLTERGIPAHRAKQRAASLSHAELSLIQQEIDQLPAGQGALGLLGAVFIVLLLLEVLGVTNVFNKI